jgi:tetratricopeptide (TPR) repeat protein
MEPEVARLLDEQRNNVLRTPRSGEAWGQLGQALFVNGFEREAVACFAEAERLQPDEPRWPYLGGVCLSQSDRASAVERFRKAAGLSSARFKPELRFRLADVLLSEGRLDEAELELETLAVRFPTHPRLRLLRGVLAGRRGDWRSCSEQLAGLTTLPQARRQATTLLAAARRRLGDVDQADRLARLAMTLAEDAPWDDQYVEECMPFARGMTARYIILVRMPTEDEQVRGLLEIIDETQGKDARAFVLLSDHMRRSGRHDLAEKAARDSVAARPDGRGGLLVLCSVLLDRAEQSRRTNGDYDKQDLAALREMEGLAERALRHNANDAWMLLYRGRARFGLGRKQEGLSDLRVAVTCRPDLFEAHYHLGETLLQAGQLEEAREALGRAKRQAPADQNPVDESMRRLDEAEKKARQP